jgi:putative glutamine amidotransferase
MQGIDVTVDFLVHTHVDLLAAAGCMPVLLPLVPEVERIVDLLDGLLLAGGPDVDPKLYRATAHPTIRAVGGGVDAAELALTEPALSAGVPFLGICRGMQLLNVHRGGTLYQYIPEIVGHDGHLPDPEVLKLGKQRLDLKPGSQIAMILGEDTPDATCHHHQAVDQVGTGLVATAWAPDGIIETIEAVDHPFAVGVQWEAHYADDARLYQAFAEAARTNQNGRALTEAARH